ncbi:aldo/keto reductase [Enemella sp. A6]|uniref:aldo/keto reductase n=1 Tax=Enemella sp. A6 TaxID=3440152 RepID=UPI003EB8B000
MTVRPRRIGDVEVGAVGMGAMTITQVDGWTTEAAERTIHAALDAGVRYFDTADTYGPPGAPGVNETVLAACLADYPGSTEDVLIGTKGGHLRYGPPDSWWLDGRPEHLRKAAIGSLQRLGLDVLPFYQLHRPDPAVPLAESLGGLAALHSEGLVRRIGVSNVNADQLSLARHILGERLVAVQNPLAPDLADPGSLRVLAHAAKLGLAFLAYSPFGGRLMAKAAGANITSLTTVAERHGVSRHRVVLAWLLALSPALIPIPGASRPESVRDNMAAARLDLGKDELQMIHDEITNANAHQESE